MNTFVVNKILIIGDRSEKVVDLERTVAGLGYETMTVSGTTEAACAMIQAVRPDLTLLDSDLDDREGESLSFRLNRDYDLPVVLVTSKPVGKWAADGGAGGVVYGCLSLPVQEREFKDMLQTVFVRHQVEVERRRLGRHMVATQRLEGIGFIGSRVAHDFNNMLQVVIGHAQLAMLDLPAGSPVQTSLDEVLKAALGGAALCRQFLSYSATAAKVPKLVELSALVRESQVLLRAVVRKGLAIEYSLAQGLPFVDIAPTVVLQMLFNLVINASEAASDVRPGTIRIATGRTWMRPAELAATVGAPERPEGEYVFFEVTDDAGGISAEVAVRMFEPFFTTKFAGNGLGLTAVRGLAHANGGAITVDSRPQVGATFRVYLPAPRTQTVA